MKATRSKRGSKYCAMYAGGTFYINKLALGSLGLSAQDVQLVRVSSTRKRVRVDLIANEQSMLVGWSRDQLIIPTHDASGGITFGAASALRALQVDQSSHKTDIHPRKVAFPPRAIGDKKIVGVYFPELAIGTASKAPERKVVAQRVKSAIIDGKKITLRDRLRTVQNAAGSRDNTINAVIESSIGKIHLQGNTDAVAVLLSKVVQR